jgi:hypothetical protein
VDRDTSLELFEDPKYLKQQTNNKRHNGLLQGFDCCRSHNEMYAKLPALLSVQLDRTEGSRTFRSGAEQDVNNEALPG